MFKRFTTKEFIDKSLKKHGDKYDYSKVDYINSRTKVIVICKKHGEFKIKPPAHFNLGQGCKECSVLNRTTSFEEFIKKSHKVHNNLYDYPKQNFEGVTSCVKIICSKHGEFVQKGYSHLNGNGCRECGTERTAKKTVISLKQFKTRASKVHKNRYNYNKVYQFKNTSEKIEIICPEHGVFTQAVGNHLYGHGCYHCGNERRIIKGRGKWEDVYRKLKKIHGDKYIFNKSSYIMISEKINVHCKVHNHDFDIKVSSLLNGQGCYHCGINKIVDFLKSDWDSTYEKIKKVHGNRYSYNLDTFDGRKSPMEINCHKHGVFIQEPSIHIAGHGCPNCNSSIGENYINLYLSNNKINFETQRTFKGLKMKRKLKVDFYLEAYNLVIEYNGRQHYEPIGTFGGVKALLRTQKSDNIKKQFCKKNNINFEVIRYDQDTEERLREILSKYK